MMKPQFTTPWGDFCIGSTKLPVLTECYEPVDTQLWSNPILGGVRIKPWAGLLRNHAVLFGAHATWWVFKSCT